MIPCTMSMLMLIVMIISLCIEGRLSMRNDRYDKYNSFFKWAKASNFSTSKIFLNFTATQEKYIANTDIETNDTLMIIPSKLFISFNQTLNLTTSKMQEKYKKFLNDSNANKYFYDLRIKRQAFLAAIFSQAQLKQKGKVYKQLSPYLSFIRESYDTYPIFFSEDITNLISNTHLGKLILKGKQSINDEYDYITKVLKIKIDPDIYTTHRVLGEAQTKIVQGEQYIIPLPDLISMNPLEFNAVEEYDEVNNATIIKAAREIQIGEVIELQSHITDNTLNFMYYGKAFEGGLKTHYPISVLHRRLIEKYRRSEGNEGDKLLKSMQENFDIGKDDYIKDGRVIEKYRKMAKEISYEKRNKNNDDLTPYDFLLENLMNYKEDYDEIKDSDYYHIIISKENMQNIKKIIDSERRLINKRIDELRDLITSLSIKQQNKNKKDL